MNKKKKHVKENDPHKSMPVDNNYPSNPNVTTKFADVFQLVSRTDDLVMLRFFSKIPGINLEEARFLTKRELLVSMVNVICQGLDYYPEPKKNK